MRNIEARIHVKLEVKVPIEIFLRAKKNGRKKNGPMQKFLTQANHLKIMIHAKNILTHVKI